MDSKKFEIWVLTDDKDKLFDVKGNIEQHYTLMDHKSFDNEGLEKYIVIIESLNALLELPYILGDDIVIYGCDSDILMTKYCMKQMGLS